jgi:hypothetical protein
MGCCWIKIGELHNGDGYKPYTDRKQGHLSFHLFLLYNIDQSYSCRDLKRNIIEYSRLKYPITEKERNNSYREKDHNTAVSGSGNVVQSIIQSNGISASSTGKYGGAFAIIQSNGISASSTGKGSAFILSLNPQHGHHKPPHCMISQTRHLFCPVE